MPPEYTIPQAEGQGGSTCDLSVSGGWSAGLGRRSSW